MNLKTGHQLAGGRYRVERVLGQGGFGITYEARDTKFKSRVKSVAIKEFFVKDFCNREQETNRIIVATQSKVELVEKLRNKFIDEANALFELEHPGIVRVTDIFEENGTAYYVMEYVNGSSLSSLVEKNGRLGESEALGYIRQVADALMYVHSQNRLHLDIKPQNIMVDGNGKAVLIDFGVSKQYDEVKGENTSTLLGCTPGYAPIEQIGGEIVEFHAATDVYSLGATLYKLITGITPASANKRASSMKLKELAFPDDITPATRAAIDAAMRLYVENRPQSIGEFLEIVESGKVRDESGEVKDERGEMKDDSDGVEDCPPVLRGTSAAEGVNDSPVTDDGETVVGNSSVSCHPERSEGSYKHANREILPPSGRQNDNGEKMKDESGEMKDERKGLGGTSKKKWAIIIAVLVIGAVAALLGTLSDGGSSNDYEGKLVPILDNSNDKWGYADTLGNIVFEPQYDRAGFFSEGLAWVKKDGKDGFIDKTGRVVIGLQYDNAGSFSDGLAVVEKDDKYGFIDKTGRVVIGLQYDYADSFSEGLAWVEKDGKWGYIDKTGRVVVEPQYDRAGSFSDGLAVVRKDGKSGFIDKTGRVVVEPQYDGADPFSEGLAVVLKDGKFGYIDKTGRVVVGLQYDIAYSFSEGLANVRKDGKNGFIDKTGRVVIGLQYDIAGSFSDGLAVVKKDGKWGFIDKTGRVVIGLQYDRAYSFSDGLAMVVKDGKSGFIDKTGRVVIGLQYDIAGSFSDGLAVVKKDGKWGHIDKTGRVVVEPQYDRAYSFSEGLAVVEKNGKEFFIDKTGREYIKW